MLQLIVQALMAIHITFDDLAGLWYAWLLFFAFGMIILIVPILLKRRYKLFRTPFDFELRASEKILSRTNSPQLSVGMPSFLSI